MAAVQGFYLATLAGANVQVRFLAHVSTSCLDSDAPRDSAVTQCQQVPSVLVQLLAAHFFSALGRVLFLVRGSPQCSKL